MHSFLSPKGHENDKYASQIYDRGQSCWNGPTRSMKVNVLKPVF